MRTTIEIDENLMRAALRATGLSTKREVVELALKTLLRVSAQTQLRQLRGKLHWTGNLDAMRLDETVEPQSH